MSLIKGIHHVSMKCSSTEEYEKTIDFYKNILGIPVAREWQSGIMLDTGNGIVEIFNDGDDAPGKGVIRHFAFATDDVDACVEAVKAAGYEVFIEPKDIEIASTPVFPARIAFCKGPLGEEIELLTITRCKSNKQNWKPSQQLRTVCRVYSKSWAKTIRLSPF